MNEETAFTWKKLTIVENGGFAIQVNKRYRRGRAEYSAVFGIKRGEVVTPFFHPKFPSESGVTRLSGISALMLDACKVVQLDEDFESRAEANRLAKLGHLQHAAKETGKTAKKREKERAAKQHAVAK